MPIVSHSPEKFIHLPAYNWCTHKSISDLLRTCQYAGVIFKGHTHKFQNVWSAEWPVYLGENVWLECPSTSGNMACSGRMKWKHWLHILLNDTAELQCVVHNGDSGGKAYNPRFSQLCVNAPWPKSSLFAPSMNHFGQWIVCLFANRSTSTLL